MMLWALITAFASEAPEGTPFATLPYVHHTALNPKKKAEPAYPSGAEVTYERRRCMVWVHVDAEGAPAAVKVLEDFPGQNCTPPFQAAAKAAIGEWTWKPPKIDKQKVAVHTQIAVVFAAPKAKPLVDVSMTGSPPPEPVPQPKRSVTGAPKDEVAPKPAKAPKPPKPPKPDPIDEDLVPVVPAPPPMPVAPVPVAPVPVAPVPVAPVPIPVAPVPASPAPTPVPPAPVDFDFVPQTTPPDEETP